MIIGRKKEIEKLRDAYNKEQAQLVAVYGRRRIGKTFLIRETFKNKFFLSFSGAYKATRAEQLRNFYDTLVLSGFQPEKKPANWWEAFNLLRNFIESSNIKRKVIFFDEMPWMDTPRSGFVKAFEYFWNSWASGRDDILFIICGSASSWIINKIFKNKGGLHNRVSVRVHLHQFNLNEVSEFVRSRHLDFSNNEILEGYMVMGGVPYYWDKLNPKDSMARNINDLFLNENGELRYEFRELYDSIFDHPVRYVNVIEALATKRRGLTREEISKYTQIENNGHLTKVIEDLIECGFIRKYCSLNKKLKDALFQLVDCYTLFYYQFIRKAYGMDEDYWLKILETPAYHTWCGLSFEIVCLLHISQIKSALGIAGVRTGAYSWHIKKNDEHSGVQIDLLIERADRVINVCEMKYAPMGFHITRQTADSIRNKCAVLSLYAPKSYAIQPVLITSNGATGQNTYFSHLPVISSEELFKAG